jgi:hypothetical protein
MLSWQVFHKRSVTQVKTEPQAGTGKVMQWIDRDKRVNR